MVKRTCDACGEARDLHGGKTCSNGHFYCRACILSSVHFGERTVCELCGESLK